MSDGTTKSRDESSAPSRLDASGETLQVREPSDYESTAVAVVSAVSEAGGRDMTDLPPLYDAVEPGALDRLAASKTVEIQFQFAGYEVAVSSDEVRVRRLLK